MIRVLCLALLASAPSPLLQDANPSQTAAAMHLLPPGHWADFKKLSHNYPTLAGIARIEGEVIVAVFYSAQGRPIKAKAISGPPQLCSVAESLGMQQDLPSLPKEPPAPWLSFLRMNFRLAVRAIEITPAPTEKIPSPEEFRKLVRNPGTLQSNPRRD